MLRLIARWLISRSIDEDRRVPNWLRNWIDRDDELKRFELLSRQLGGQLKDDARRWSASRELPAGVGSVGRQPVAAARSSAFRRPRLARPQRALSLGALTLGTLAAGAWLVVGQWPSPPDQANEPKHVQDRPIVQATVEITAADREWLAAAWKAGRANLDELRSRAGAPLGRAETLKLPALSPVVESAGSTAVRALATLDRSMTSEQQRLASDAKAAFSFFTYRLPASLARLVGWRPASH